jgi:cytochrome P450
LRPAESPPAVGVTPASIARYEQPTRALVTELIDGFIEAGACEFMEQFARPFPAMMFFQWVVHAPREEIARIKDLATKVTMPSHPDHAAALEALFNWVGHFLDSRRTQPPFGDLIDAVLHAEIQGRPIANEEVLGIVNLLMIGPRDVV